MWAGQADVDTSQAHRLAEARSPRAPHPGLTVAGGVGLTFLPVDPLSAGYEPALRASAADRGEPLDLSPTEGTFAYEGNVDSHSASMETQPPGKTIVCFSLPWKGASGLLERLAQMIQTTGVHLVWADSLDRDQAEALGRELARQGFSVVVKPLCGRSLRDQVWWKRWVMAASCGDGVKFPWVSADDEPCTPPLLNYPLEWLADDGGSSWEPGVLRLDSSMPYLGAAKPKPAGTLLRPKEGRALVWDPKRPLPGLHLGSWDSTQPDRLLLLGKGPDGPAARPISRGEAMDLLNGRRFRGGELQRMEAQEVLNLPRGPLLSLP